MDKIKKEVTELAQLLEHTETHPIPLLKEQRNLCADCGDLNINQSENNL
jgi:hypothetical protein